MKILILDEQGLFLDAARFFLDDLRPKVEILTASKLENGLENLRNHSDIALVLVNAKKLKQQNRDPLNIIREYAPGVPLCLLSDPLPRSEVMHLMQKGLVGYFPKNMRSEVFVHALRLVLAGEKYMPFDLDGVYYTDEPEETNRYVVKDGYSRQKDFAYDDGEDKALAGHMILPSTETLASLSAREMQTLKALRDGLSNKGIAVKFGVQEVTVKQHVSAVLRKLSLKNRTEAAMVARELNL